MKNEKWFFSASILAMELIATAMVPAVTAQEIPAKFDPLAWPVVNKESRPWTRWWWMGSAVNKEDITRELDRYAKAGLGGVEITPIYGVHGYEGQFIDYLSPQWMEMLKHTVTEANRLGLGVDMATCTGWCFGGPNVSDNDANASAVYKDGTISQKPSDVKVKRPAPGGEGWMLNLLYPDAMDRYLQRFTDAFAKYNGPKLHGQFHDSYEYKSDWSPDFFEQFQKRRGYDLRGNQKTPTASHSKRSEAQRNAVEEPRGVANDAVSRSSNDSRDSSTPLRSARNDSESKLTELDALFENQGDPDHVARVKSDYRETVSDLIEESIQRWTKWSHDHGWTTRNQAHGSPGNWLDIYAASDIPETEMFYKDRDILVSKFASSAAHVTGKNLVGAETGTWVAEHFTETLADLKYLVDDMFLAGVNRITWHGSAYSPDDAPWPGWSFYASTEMNPRNAIWRDVPALNTYIARVQSVLQSGRPDNDILLYWPIHDDWHNDKGMVQPLTIHGRDWFDDQPIGKVARMLWQRGFAFDYVSDKQLLAAKAEPCTIDLSGNKYSVIVVPECRHMPVETLKTLLALADKGASVIFEKQFPDDVPGALELDKRRAELRHELEQFTLTGAGDLKESTLGEGRIVVGDLEKALARENVKPEPLTNRSDLKFVRREVDGRHVYFIANRGKEHVDTWVTFGTSATVVEFLDPMTGRCGFPMRPGKSDEAPQIHLQLEAGASVILRESLVTNISSRVILSGVEQQRNAIEESRETSGGAGLQAAGQTRDPSTSPRGGYPEQSRTTQHDTRVVGIWRDLQSAGEPIALNGKWNVKFIEGGPVLPKEFSTEKLASWTELGGEDAQSFAGTARYTLTFDAPDNSAFRKEPALSSSNGHSAFLLDLGKVVQSARVKLNGKELGTVFIPPFRVAVDELKPKGNVLEVEVTGTSANRIRDLDRRGVKWKIFYDTNIVNLNYKPFDASKWPVAKQGLLGPVTLQAERALKQ